MKVPSWVENGQLKDHPCYSQLLTAYHPEGDNNEALNRFLAPSFAEQSDKMRNHVRSRGRDKTNAISG